ncbi:hypothetical protein [Nostoc sp.]|uniref:hypothetical protein n=1 Tax=Nostoc sp. TaxID=1180 RepID=UPI002FF920FE
MRSLDYLNVFVADVRDGVGGRIFGVLSVLMVADLTKGTGRFNVTQGILVLVRV